MNHISLPRSLSRLTREFALKLSAEVRRSDIVESREMRGKIAALRITPQVRPILTVFHCR